MSIIEQLNDGIKESMRARDSIRLNTLRMLKSKILAVDARGNVADADALKLFKTYLSNLEEALEHARSVNKTEASVTLEQEIIVVQGFLPKALSREETEKLVTQAIQDTGAKAKKELGFVMKRVMELNNAVDGKLAKELISQALPD